MFGPMENHIIHDVRFRLSAYKFCNLQYLFRIDAEDENSGLLEMLCVIRDRYGRAAP